MKPKVKENGLRLHQLLLLGPILKDCEIISIGKIYKKCPRVQEDILYFYFYFWHCLRIRRAFSG